MWLPLLSALSPSRPGRRPARRKPVSARLAVEALEDRCVPAFLAPVTSPGGGLEVAVGDMNHDGRDDVAAVSGQVGSWTPPGWFPYNTAVLNKDRVSVSLSNGDGTFRQSSTLSGVKGYYLSSIALRDVNGDGHLDVEVSTRSRSYKIIPGGEEGVDSYAGTAYDNVWLGKGDGTFGHVSTTASDVTLEFGWPVPYNVTFLWADFTHDGLYDKAWVDGSTPVVSVTLATGTVQDSSGNTLSIYGTTQAYSAGPNPAVIAAGDFNGDGWTDLIVVNSLSSNQPTLSVLLNDRNW